KNKGELARLYTLVFSTGYGTVTNSEQHVTHGKRNGLKTKKVARHCSDIRKGIFDRNVLDLCLVKQGFLPNGGGGWSKEETALFS
ncbi:hypothetical protein, partial [Enterococcus faecalis]|uniref:hypothetical protein n=1 Tax=Enterococcus faecalis TaxID=1351 RepID=UPI002073DB4F